MIVESPAKARTIAGYLGPGYVVESSIGHIRDMPDKAAEIPAKYRSQPWARLGVNIDAGFEPLYVVHSDKKQQVAKLKQLLKGADELLLATDEDREGEAIAWHLLEELNPKVPAHRMVFHEITPEAIAQAVAHPREMDNGLVDAYQTRRVLDRLYGYEVSPVLWKKVMPRLSAGRVQSVAVRLVVDRERERIAFRAARYWDLEAEFARAGREAAGQDDGPGSFTATLVSVDGRRVAQGRDFTPAGELKGAPNANLLHLDGEQAAALADRLGKADFAVSSVERKPYRRSPYAPFRTTTLQQEASRKLGFSAKYTMSIAQRLYENGYITYMRTDSVILSQTALTAARTQARELYGDAYVPEKPRTYASKVKNAQEAHEAIRPAGDSFRTPAEVRRAGLSGDEFRLYELVWKRTVASQMKDATGESVSVRVAGVSSAGERAEFGASGKVIGFYGFLKAYVEDADDPDAERDDRERRLPPVAEGDPLEALRLAASGHETRPPARYTEATLVRELEEREIGRPSTYASIIGTILDRGYVFKKGTALVPSFLAFAVTTLLEQHFGHLVDYEFTARMEDALDQIARGEAGRVPWLRRFYFGSDGEEGLKELVSDLTDIDAREVSSFPLADSDIVVRVGRYGPYLERGDQRVNIPEGTAPDELTAERAAELFDQPSGDRELGTDPETGHQIVARAGRFGPYVTEQPGTEAGNGAGDRVGEAAHGIAAQVHDAGDGHAGGRAEAALAAPADRRAGRRAGHGAERPVRPVRQEGHRQPLAGARGAAVRHHPGRGEGTVRPAQGARPPDERRGGPAAARARRGPRVRQVHGDQGRPLGAVRDRRRDQRVAAQGRHGGIGHGRSAARNCSPSGVWPPRRRRRGGPAGPPARRGSLRRGSQGPGQGLVRVPDGRGQIRWRREHPIRARKRTRGRSGHPPLPPAVDRAVAVQPR